MQSDRLQQQPSINMTSSKGCSHKLNTQKNRDALREPQANLGSLFSKSDPPCSCLIKLAPSSGTHNLYMPTFLAGLSFGNLHFSLCSCGAWPLSDQHFGAVRDGLLAPPSSYVFVEQSCRASTPHIAYRNSAYCSAPRMVQLNPFSCSLSNTQYLWFYFCTVSERVRSWCRS